jgi:hypothetical protein
MVTSDPSDDSQSFKDVVLDWQGTPIISECLVLFPRKWGKNRHSTEMVKAVVLAVNSKKRIRIKVLATSRTHLWKRRHVYAAPRHSMTVISSPKPNMSSGVSNN